MKISLVIPTYNEEKYLPKMFGSLERSSITPDEIIVVDDQSTDRTREIARDFGAEVIVVDRRSIGYARKIGMLAAKGDILVSGSADMIVDRYWLENITSPIKIGFDLSFGRIDIDSNHPVDRWFAKILNTYSNISFRWFGLVWASGDNISISRRFYHKILGFRDLKMGEDIELIRRALGRGKIYYANDAVIYTSDRRVRKWGRVRFFLYYLFSYLMLNTGNVIYLKEYESIR
ncbi:MAG: glycosyltransferase [Candidatus Micrarchaeota archaeon]|nr:glycosyltransferase [Candidatus Micrarchaeota archaeon]MCX8154484.1 glycosyltransferase [Candidatus Micrarchaeota archaeon]